MDLLQAIKVDGLLSEQLINFGCKRAPLFIDATVLGQELLKPLPTFLFRNSRYFGCPSEI